MHLNNKPDHQRQLIKIRHDINYEKLDYEDLKQTIEYKFLKKNHENYFMNLIHKRLRWLPYSRKEREEMLKQQEEKK